MGKLSVSWEKQPGSSEGAGVKCAKEKVVQEEVGAVAGQEQSIEGPFTEFIVTSLGFILRTLLD